MTFTATIKIREGNPYILVSKVRASRLKQGWKKPLPVLIQINGEPNKAWRINMMPVGDGSFYLYLHGDVRRASNTGVGDKVEVHIEFDSSYKNGPQHPMPAWFGEALAKNKKAQSAWQKLPPSRQKEILRYFSWLKSDAARERNIKLALHVLSGHEGRFMARSWKDGKWAL